MLCFGKPTSGDGVFWLGLNKVLNKGRVLSLPTDGTCQRHILRVLLPLRRMQIADVNPSALYPNGILMSRWVLNLQVRKGRGKETPELSMSVTLLSSPCRGCGGWGDGEGSAPLLLCFPCPDITASGLPLQNQIWVSVLNSEDPFLGISNTVGMKVRNGVT